MILSACKYIKVFIFAVSIKKFDIIKIFVNMIVLDTHKNLYIETYSS